MEELVLDPTVWVGAAIIWAFRWRAKRRSWKPISEAEKDGIVFYVRRWPHKHEIGRVGFDRPRSENPDKDFDEMVGEVMSRARQRCSHLNATRRHFW